MQVARRFWGIVAESPSGFEKSPRFGLRKHDHLNCTKNLRISRNSWAISHANLALYCRRPRGRRSAPAMGRCQCISECVVGFNARGPQKGGNRQERTDDQHACRWI
jgi:hypothetical protein